MKKKRGQKLFVHSLLENPAILRKSNLYLKSGTLSKLVSGHKVPRKKTIDGIIKTLKEYEEYKNIPYDELEKRLCEPVK